MPKISFHGRVIIQALFVTFLWSTSWVFIKIGLKDIPALTFAGLRYVLAFLALLPFALKSGSLRSISQLPRGMWGRLILLGLIVYSLTQGAQFLSLAYLPAATVSLFLSFSTVLVALFGMAYLKERPGKMQWIGTGMYLVGVFLYLNPVEIQADQKFGLAIALVGLLANALASILGRDVNRTKNVDPLGVTLVSMGVGSFVLLLTGIVTQGMPKLTPGGWGIVLWLAVVNSAFAFTLWNRTLQDLSAMESSILNNTMLFQIAILAWLFLDEVLSFRQVFGILTAGVGILVFQVGPSKLFWAKRDKKRAIIATERD